jgi:hypothetical protein
MSVAKRELTINVTKFDQGEIIKLVKSECDDFNYIPEHEQWVMALYALGNTNESIAELTGRTIGSVNKAVDTYATLVSTIPDGAKIMINLRRLFNVSSNYFTVMTDREKIEKLTPKQAGEVLLMQFEIMREYMKIEQEYVEHQAKMKSLTFDGFGKTLGAK